MLFWWNLLLFLLSPLYFLKMLFLVEFAVFSSVPTLFFKVLIFRCKEHLFGWFWDSRYSRTKVESSESGNELVRVALYYWNFPKITIFFSIWAHCSVTVTHPLIYLKGRKCTSKPWHIPVYQHNLRTPPPPRGPRDYH